MFEPASHIAFVAPSKSVSIWAIILLFVTFVTEPLMPAHAKNAHDISFENIEGGTLDLAEFRGKVILLVNTASQCGFTPQYEALQAMWDNYRDRGLVVIGVPSNDFGGQEPGANSQIKQFCTINYGIDFPMTEKVAVTGSDIHPYYQWVLEAGGRLAMPRWNFYKHLIDQEGNFVTWFAATTAPDARKIRQAIEKLLPN
ncbi:glutathione peroxidase [Candidatus Puniceispirillum marinum]|uniref:Glutathione peroxidase n=1 Tax=Puniceispirillum marinum (strain IMCC1322) TaxID=488538 RepID=D5BPV4_PUNMI|nr:glutathione peroxidase [Candidatus Puniceispirillum marinum]ADE40606.1 Phospholipid hydroperoxide glutathione peroxidase [Candidatus Puniceispirillum marinum IMCC1322]